MKLQKFILYSTFAMAVLTVTTSCEKYVDEPAENKALTVETDYTIASDMIKPLIGAYTELNNTEWEDLPLIGVRGDDVNAGGLGDQQNFWDTDYYMYNKDFWMYNSLFQNYYRNIFSANSSIEQILKYQEAGASAELAQRYIAEVKVLKAWWLFNLSRVWGALPVPPSSDPSELLVTAASSKDEIMATIVTWMDEAIPLLPAIRPNERTDLPGGVTKFTALAMKALASLEINDFNAVAQSTGEIINSGKFQLESDFYELFKIQGKLNNENVFELQYSDLGQGSGDNFSYLFAFYGPQGWTPQVAGAADGWGFWEPSLKYIKFMLDRGETVRLETSVIFTDRGISELQADPKYASLPSWISSTTRSGDKFNDYARAMFASGKHYLPSNQLTPGRQDYGTNKNYTLIRYAEILLMYAEAVVQGGPQTAGTAENAVNLVRERVDLPALSSVTLDQILNEKFAELAMETGTRYYDMVRYQKYNELSYDGRTFSPDKIFLPYPQNQLDQIPTLPR